MIQKTGLSVYVLLFAPHRSSSLQDSFNFSKENSYFSLPYNSLKVIIDYNDCIPRDSINLRTPHTKSVKIRTI